MVDKGDGVNCFGFSYKKFVKFLFSLHYDIQVKSLTKYDQTKRKNSVAIF